MENAMISNKEMVQAHLSEAKAALHKALLYPHELSVEDFYDIKNMYKIIEEIITGKKK